MSRQADGSPIFDSLDVDLVIKVLSHTAFSPFFICLVPIFYSFNGSKVTDPIVVTSAVWFILISTFWAVKWTSLLYRNQGSLFFAPPRFDWGEQIVVITGGSSGIGELLANTLAVRNVNVVVLDVKPIETENYNITYYKCDISKWEEVESVAKKISEEIGDPTVLVNNAGVVQGRPILDLSHVDIQQTFGVNALSHFWTLKAFLPSMIEKKSGHIVTISSIMGYTGVARMSDYNATKGALMNLHETLRIELDKVYNCPSIRTTLVVPGRVLTPLFKRMSMSPSPFRKFFMPDVAPVTVVKKIITALDDQHSQTIILPFYANFMPLLRFLPSYLRDFASWITSADKSMDHFEKLSGLREDEMPKN